MDSSYVLQRWGRPDEEIYCYSIDTMLGLDIAWWTTEAANAAGCLHPPQEMTSC